MKQPNINLKQKKMPAKRIEIYVEMEDSETDFPADVKEVQDDLADHGYEVELIGTRPTRRNKP